MFINYEQYLYFFRITTNGQQEETLSQSSIDIPLNLYLEKHWKKNYFKNQGRNKIGIPVKTKNTLVKSDINTRIYYPDLNAEIYDIAYYDLYENKTDISNEKKINSKINTSITGEIGFLFPINKNLRIGSSLFGSYGINNINPEENYWIDENLNYNGIMSVSDKTNTWQMGINLSINFGFVGKVRVNTTENNKERKERY